VVHDVEIDHKARLVPWESMVNGAYLMIQLLSDSCCISATQEVIFHRIKAEVPGDEDSYTMGIRAFRWTVIA